MCAVHDIKGRSLPHGVTIWDQRESFCVEPKFCVIFETHEHVANLIDHHRDVIPILDSFKVIKQHK